MKILNKKEETFMKMAIEYKKQYEECDWWKFKKRNELYKSHLSAINLMVRYAK